MIIILSINSEKFSLNGIPYFKNFMPHIISGKLKIVNVYDTSFELSGLDLYTNYSVNGVVFTSLIELQNALLPVLYSRNSLNFDSDLPFYNQITKENGITNIGLTKMFTAGWEWLINNVKYSNVTNQTLTFPLATSGKQRLDRVVATNLNTFIRIPGVESVSSPSAEPRPDNTIDVTFVLVTDSIVGNPSPPIVGDAFITKASKSYIRMFQTGDVDSFPVDDRSYLQFESGMLSLKSLSISQPAYVYHGKDFIFKNRTNGDVTLYHSSGSGNFKFNIPGGHNLILKPEESVHFVMRVINSNENSGLLDYVGISSTDSEFVFFNGSTIQKQTFNTSSPEMVDSLTTATFSFSENGLIISGGDGSFTNFSKLPEYSQLEDYQIETSVFRSTIPGAGLGLGIDCLYGEYAICKADLSASSGKIYISTNKATFTIYSNDNLSFDSNDDLQIVLKRTKFSISAYFNNLSTGKSVVATYDVSDTASMYGTGKNINRNGRPSIWAFGGTQTFEKSGYISYKSFAYKNPILAIVGTSIEYGYASGQIYNRWVSLGGRANFLYDVLPGASSTSTDIVNVLPEILKIKPQYLAINCVINDAVLSISSAVTQSNIEIINNFCIKNNIKTIWCTSSPTSNVSYNSSISISNSYILGLSGVTRFVDFYSHMIEGSVLNPIYDSGDGVHPNRLGHHFMSNFFIEQTLGLFAYKNINDFDLTQNFTNNDVSANFSGKVGFGNTNPLQPIDVTGNLSIRYSGVDGHGFVWTNTDAGNYKWNFAARPSDDRISLYNFNHNNSPFVVLDNGKIIIGSPDIYPTDNGIDALQIKGSLISDKIRINTSITNPSAGNAVLNAGTVTINTPMATTSSLVILTRKIGSGTLGFLSYSSGDGVFTITSSSSTDTSTITFLIIN